MSETTQIRVDAVHNKTAKNTGLALPLILWGATKAAGLMYGDIGTSPLYVMKAVVGENVMTYQLLAGCVQVIALALTIIASTKYMWRVLQNNIDGRGGMPVLQQIATSKSTHTVKEFFSGLSIGGTCALIIDACLTPAITMTSASESFVSLGWVTADWVPYISAFSILLLYGIQPFGTAKLAPAFGPIMALWFLTLAGFGIYWITQAPAKFIAELYNPSNIILLASTAKGGILVLLAAVFLCTTGGEAPYSDMAHSDKRSITLAWGFIKPALILQYIGQGAMLAQHNGKTITEAKIINVFFSMFPSQPWLLYGAVIALVASFIASQSLISGTFSLFAEWIKLKVWPKMRVSYIGEHADQIYISSVNWALMIASIAVVLLVRDAIGMEPAYCIFITIVMLVTTTLLTYREIQLNESIPAKIGFGFLALIFFGVESLFLVANVAKVQHELHHNGLLGLKAFILLLVMIVICIAFIFIVFTFKTEKRRRKSIKKSLSLEHAAKILANGTHVSDKILVLPVDNFNALNGYWEDVFKGFTATYQNIILVTVKDNQSPFVKQVTYKGKEVFGKTVFHKINIVDGFKVKHNVLADLQLLVQNEKELSQLHGKSVRPLYSRLSIENWKNPLEKVQNFVYEQLTKLTVPIPEFYGLNGPHARVIKVRKTETGYVSVLPAIQKL